MALNGKTALITGGVSGLGKHLAEDLHAQGVTLVIADINEASGASFIAELNGRRANSAFFHKTDVTKWADQVSLFKSALSNVKRLDFVFANAGMGESAYLPTGSSVSSPGDWVEPNISTININVIGVLYTTNLAVQVFKAQEKVGGVRGKVIVTASIISFNAVPFLPMYTTSKHALTGFIRSMGPTFASEGIYINGVGPNLTRTGLIPQAAFDATEQMGTLTPIETVTKAFLSFLGPENTDSGVIKEATMSDIVAHAPEAPLNASVKTNVEFLAASGKAMYDAATESVLGKGHTLDS